MAGAARPGKTRFEQILAVLVGLTALAAALLAVLQLDTGRKSNRAGLQSARLPIRIFESIASSGLYRDFHINNQRTAAAFGVEALGRQISALKATDAVAFEGAIGRADFASVQRLRAAADEMAAITLASRGVDRATREAMEATPEDLQALVEVQGAQVDEATAQSGRQTRTVFGLSLVAAAAALLGLAAVLRTAGAGRIALGAGALALAGSVAWGASAVAL